jgi:hypothetical protein
MKVAIACGPSMKQSWLEDIAADMMVLAIKSGEIERDELETVVKKWASKSPPEMCVLVRART